MLGGGLIVLPGRNFSRYILMIYIIFCFVLRNAYIGQQYILMLKVGNNEQQQNLVKREKFGTVTNVSIYNLNLESVLLDKKI